MTEQEQNWLKCEDPAKMFRLLDPRNARIWKVGQCDLTLSNRKLRLIACAFLGQCNQELIKKSNHQYKYGDEGEGIPDNTLLTIVYDWCSTQREYDPPASVKVTIFHDIVGNPFRPVTLPYVGEKGSVNYHPSFPVQLHPDAKCPWLIPQVLTLAQAAYEERGWKCERCGGKGREHDADSFSGYGVAACQRCNGRRTTDDGTLDDFRLSLVADALEDAGCPLEIEEDKPCKACGGDGWGRRELREARKKDPDAILDGCIPCKGSGKVRCRVPCPLLEHLRSSGPHFRGCFALDLILGKE